MRNLLLTCITLLLFSGCCISQIPTQYYFLNDSGFFYLPDYTKIIEVKDNCEVISFYQTPTSGTQIICGNDIQVSIIATDWTGNTITMSFDVIGIDNLPPTFYYDSTDFLPTGMYQNKYRTYHFYTFIKPDSTFNLYYK